LAKGAPEHGDSEANTGGERLQAGSIIGCSRLYCLRKYRHRGQQDSYYRK
jgi:hypothetical protein